MKVTDLEPVIIGWGEDRGILAGDPQRQFLKTISEFGETADAVAKDEVADLLDGIGDTLVTLILVARMTDIDLDVSAFSERGDFLRYCQVAGIEVMDAVPEEIVLRSSVMIGVMSHAIITQDDEWFQAKARDLCLELAKLANSAGSDLDECLSTAWNEIKDRKGRTVAGVFIKA